MSKEVEEKEKNQKFLPFQSTKLNPIHQWKKDSKSNLAIYFRFSKE
jgi:hypothetical protein